MSSEFDSWVLAAIETIWQGTGKPMRASDIISSMAPEPSYNWGNRNQEAEFNSRYLSSKFASAVNRSIKALLESGAIEMLPGYSKKYYPAGAIGEEGRIKHARRLVSSGTGESWKRTARQSPEIKERMLKALEDGYGRDMSLNRYIDLEQKAPEVLDKINEIEDRDKGIVGDK